MLHVLLVCYQELHVCRRGSCGHVLLAGQSADRCCGRCYKCCRNKPQDTCARRYIAIQTTQRSASLAAKDRLAVDTGSASDSSDDSESELDIDVADTGTGSDCDSDNASGSDHECADVSGGSTTGSVPSTFQALANLPELLRRLEALAPRVDGTYAPAAATESTSASILRAIRHCNLHRNNASLHSLPPRVQRELAVVTNALVVALLNVICPSDAPGLWKIVSPRLSKHLTGASSSAEDAAASREIKCGRKLLCTLG